MRWLISHPGPHFSVADVYNGWLEALRALGQEVHEFRFDDRLNAHAAAFREDGEQDGVKLFRRMFDDEQVKTLAIDGLAATLFKYRPDVLLLVSGFFMPPAFLEHIQRSGIAVVIIHTESPYEDDRQLQLAPYAHLNLINDPVNLDRYTAVAPTLYLPHSYRPAVHHPPKSGTPRDLDFAFVGTAFGSRLEFFSRLDLSGLKMLFAGNWQALPDDSPLRPFIAQELGHCLDNTATADVYRRTRVGLNLYRREAERAELVTGVAIGPREVEMAACGMFFLRDPRPESDAIFSMLPTFADPEDAAEQIRWWTDPGRDLAREALAGKAYTAIADRTFQVHAAALLRRIIP